MRCILPLLSCLSISLFARVDALAQERHVVTDAEMRAVVVDRASAEEDDRAAIRSLLDRAEVREIAGRAGLDLRRAGAAVALLDGGELQRLAEQARQLNEGLAGGQDVIVISTTTLLIILLIVLIIVAAD